MKENIKFIASKTAPNYKEVQYWIDLQSDPYGRVIKAWDGIEWSSISGDISNIIEQIEGKADKADTLDGYGITNAYTKEEVNAKVASVYKVKGSVTNFEALSNYCVYW